MSNNPTERRNGFNAGVRACVAWLHQHAESMNDPHAKALMNTAAFQLGRNKPVGLLTDGAPLRQDETAASPRGGDSRSEGMDT